MAAASSVGWYIAFGAAHEAAHVAAAALLGRLAGAGTAGNVARTLLARHVRLPALSFPDVPSWEVRFVSHFAWVCSVAWALAAFILTRTKSQRGGREFESGLGQRSDAAAAMALAALVTALEAVASDLLRWGPSWGSQSPQHYNDNELLGDTVLQSSLFFCGNFGRGGGIGECGREGGRLRAHTHACPILLRVLHLIIPAESHVSTTHKIQIQIQSNPSNTKHILTQMERTLGSNDYDHLLLNPPPP
jgi:hypothetical protein